MALQIAIVEDLQPDAQRLQALVGRSLGVECGIFPSGDAYLQQMPARKDDLVFLDICMEGTSGIETAQQLRRADPKVLIVFVTSSPEYVWDAFPVHPFDYLLKPYEEEKFRKLAAELRRVLCRTEPELEVRIARQTVQLPLRKVLYAMAQNHFVRVVSEDGECRAACGFAQVEEKLRTEENFMSCNRGIVINMDKVLRFEDDCIEMLDGTRLPVRQKDKNALFAPFYPVPVPPHAAGTVSQERSRRRERCHLRTLFSGLCPAVPQRLSVPGLPVGKGAQPQAHRLHRGGRHHGRVPGVRCAVHDL